MKKLFRQPITPHAAIAIPAGISAVALCIFELSRALLGLSWNPALAASTGILAFIMLSPASRRSFWKLSAPELNRSATGASLDRDCD